LMKNRGRTELVAALRTARAGRWYRAEQVATRAARRPKPDDTNHASTSASYLTFRQQQVLQSLALGHPTRDIAQMLGVSVQAVHRLRERLLQALQLRGTAALTRFAVREGLVGVHAATPAATQGSEPDSLEVTSMLPGAVPTR
jgi:DNA-binding NarL/FixJ family response regulator